MVQHVGIPAPHGKGEVGPAVAVAVGRGQLVAVAGDRAGGRRRLPAPLQGPGQDRAEGQVRGAAGGLQLAIEVPHHHHGVVLLLLELLQAALKLLEARQAMVCALLALQVAVDHRDAAALRVLQDGCEATAAAELAAQVKLRLLPEGGVADGVRGVTLPLILHSADVARCSEWALQVSLEAAEHDLLQANDISLCGQDLVDDATASRSPCQVRGRHVHVAQALGPRRVAVRQEVPGEQREVPSVQSSPTRQHCRLPAEVRTAALPPQLATDSQATWR
mmetsp:Transcript_99481/g.302015  ORF Transcript_99481/g.302015 Transcript_99481/m.302015 type:complete len:277 (+) Transcript_99481:693-1523(+)